MPFLVAVALCTFFGCAVAGFDRDASRALTAVAQAAVALAVIALPRTRSAVFDFFKRFAIPSALYVALLMQAAVMSGAFYFGASGTPYRAEQAMVSLVGVGFFVASVAGAATAVGRNRMLAAMLWIPLALAFLTILDRLDGRGDFFGMIAPSGDNRVAGSFASPNEAATAFALFAVFAAFACVDELTRRPAQGAGPLPALARRLFLPTASFIASFNLLVLSGSRAGIAAGVAGLAVYFLIAWLRGRKGRAGPRIIPIVAGAVGIMALLVAVTSGGTALRRYATIAEARQSYETITTTALKAWGEKPLFGHGLGSYDLLPAGADGAPLDALRWLAEAGVLGTALLAAAIGFFLWKLWGADDHGRRPSRGFFAGRRSAHHRAGARRSDAGARRACGGRCACGIAGNSGRLHRSAGVFDESESHLTHPRALISCGVAFSCDKPASTSSENALDRRAIAEFIAHADGHRLGARTCLRRFQQHAGFSGGGVLHTRLKT